jgi:hypothetical protein
MSNKQDEIGISFRKGCPTCLSPQPHLHPAVQHEGEVSICKDPFHSQVTTQNPKVETPIGLQWGDHQRDGGTHTEWHAPCGCAYHPEPFPHVHPCSDEHKRPDLHASGERRLATREDAERFIQRELSSGQWLDEKLMISFEKESLIHALVEKWESSAGD